MTLEEAEALADDGKIAIHELKCWPVYFDAIERGDKTFEVRLNDRVFQKGDVLNLREFDPDNPVGYTGNATQMIVKYVLPGGQFGVEAGYVVMAIEPTEVE